jgi:non-canonical (house-cleaning) NTP pyrophosphatase
MSKKKSEPIEDVANRGLSNTCRIDIAEEALKKQRARLDCLENGHKWKYGVESKIVRKMLGSAATYFSCDVLVCSAIRTCAVCGKSEQVELPDKLFNKIKKLFKE